MSKDYNYIANSITRCYNCGNLQHIITGLTLYDNKDINMFYSMMKRHEFKYLTIMYKDMLYFGKYQVYEIYSNLFGNSYIHNVYLKCESPIRIYSLNVKLVL